MSYKKTIKGLVRDLSTGEVKNVLSKAKANISNRRLDLLDESREADFIGNIDKYVGKIALTKENFLKKALEIDKLFGKKFNPPKW